MRVIDIDEWGGFPPRGYRLEEFIDKDMLLE